MNKIKNAHSPAGMGYSLHGTKYKYLTDCPKCKWGTVDRYTDKDHVVTYKCADCQWKWSEEEWKKAHEIGKR